MKPGQQDDVKLAGSGVTRKNFLEIQNHDRWKKIEELEDEMRKSCGKEKNKIKIWTTGHKRKLEARSRRYDMEKELQSQRTCLGGNYWQW